MGILARQLPDVQGDTTSCRQRREEMLYKLCIKVSNPLSWDVAVETQMRPT